MRDTRDDARVQAARWASGCMRAQLVLAAKVLTVMAIAAVWAVAVMS